MLREAEAVLALGSNLGDRAALVRQAIALLDRARGMRVVATSGMWESPAWRPDGAEDAPDYVNAVALVRTVLEPLDLLDAIHAIEDALGRVRLERYGDRTIDVDVVTFDGVVDDDPRLTLPHPRAHERQFVLQPWLEVQPEAELPGHGGIAELAEYAHGDAWPLREGRA
jgi:2-amino-4-hydroxy-6-hydroxymethyldihydropteridine diphosphokinase